MHPNLGHVINLKKVYIKIKIHQPQSLYDLDTLSGFRPVNKSKKDLY